MLWCVVLFSLVVYLCIFFCMLCIISVPRSPLSINIRCKGNVYVI